MSKKEKKFTDYKPPFDFSNLATFEALDGLDDTTQRLLLLCIAYSAWQEVPSSISEEYWRTSLEMFFHYFFGNESLHQAAQTLEKVPPNETIKVRIRSTLWSMLTALSRSGSLPEDTQKELPPNVKAIEMDTRKARSIAENRQIARVILELRYADKSPTEILKKLNLTSMALRHRRREMRTKHGIVIPTLEKRSKYEMQTFLKELYDETDYEKIIELFTQIDYGWYQTLIKQNPPIITQFSNAYTGIKGERFAGNIRVFAKTLAEAQIAVGIATVTVHEGEQKGVQNYYFMRTVDVPRAREILEQTFGKAVPPTTPQPEQ